VAALNRAQQPLHLKRRRRGGHLKKRSSEEEVERLSGWAFGVGTSSSGDTQSEGEGEDACVLAPPAFGIRGSGVEL